MPPVVYPPLTNADRAFIHMVVSHGHLAADVEDLAETDLDALRFGHDHNDHAWFNEWDHIHSGGHHDRLPPWLHQMAEVTRP